VTQPSVDRDERAPALAHWLSERLGAAVAVDGWERPASGFSAETIVVPTTVDGRAQRFVLRLETPDPAVYPAQAGGLDIEIEIQVRVMQALAASDVPLATVVGYEPDTSVLGAPFFVMEFVEGRVPIENPPYTLEGFFVDASPTERAAMIDDGLRVLAAVHDVDWRAADLGWLVAPGTSPGIAAQLDLWEAYARRELDGRTHPSLDRALAWLHDNLPPGSEPVLAWGDPRPGNIIWRDGHAACATDFEAVAIAPREHDLGWWLMFDRSSHETVGAARLPGEPTRDEQRVIYERHAGIAVDDPFPFELFAAARYAAIVVRVMNRLVARGDMPPDNTIWLENPAATCLDQLLDELP
jgi:aminoglycoside phosphotransferase (APT) family kinase protein